MLKILHLAPQNYAGVPYSFYEMHNASGDYSRLITYHKHKLDFPEDICLNIPLPDSVIASKWRQKKSTSIHNNSKAPVYSSRNIVESLYFRYADFSRQSIIKNAIREYDLNSYDIIHYDGGMDFYRNSSQAIKWKSQGKKIVCCYYGSDLRVRGVIKSLDEISDLNITSEYDHLSMKEDLDYLFYPYDPSELPDKKMNPGGKIKIIHSPTNRIYKGTDLIIDVVEKIKRHRNIEFVLCENVPRKEVLQMKSEADICIDQVGGTGGGTGYGKAGLESLALGIPTITNMSPDYEKWLPENPFIVANNARELQEVLETLIVDEQLRLKRGLASREWVSKYHGFQQVNLRLKELYKTKNII